MPRVTQDTTIDELIALGLIKPNQIKAWKEMCTYTRRRNSRLEEVKKRQKRQVKEYVRDERERKAHIQRFHDKWKTVFTEARSTLVFGGIGHDPEEVEQYTPQNVTSFMKTYKRQYKKYGMSSSFRMVMSVLLAIGGAFLALSLSPFVHCLVVSEGQEMFKVRELGMPNILSLFFGLDVPDAGEWSWPVCAIALLSQIICIAGGAISIMAVDEYEDCKKDTSPNPLWAFAILSYVGAGLSACMAYLYAFVALLALFITIVAAIVGCIVFLVMSIVWPVPEVIQLKHQIMAFSFLSSCAITYYLAKEKKLID